MSWSLTVPPIAKAQAREAFIAAHQAQGAYSVDGSHKDVMDKIAAFAGDIAEAAPDGIETGLSSYGHMNSDGTGSASVTVSFGLPAPTA